MERISLSIHMGVVKMTEISKVTNNTLPNQQSVTNQRNQILSDPSPKHNIITNDSIMINNIPENPYIQNPFYQANQQANQIASPAYTPTYLTSGTLTENQSSNLWKYLLTGGLGLFTGLMLGSMMSYSYYLYHPMYYSYYYTPCWYNFGWYW